MYDLRLLREQFSSIRDQLAHRGADVAWGAINTLLQERLDLLSQVETLRHQLKKGSEEVAQLKRKALPAEEAVAAMRAVGDDVHALEQRLRTIEPELEAHALRIPMCRTARSPKGPTLRRTWRYGDGARRPSLPFRRNPTGKSGSCWAF